MPEQPVPPAADAPRRFSSLDELSSATGQVLGCSPWRTLSQERVNTFADATDDHQWIHVDPDRAAVGPFGTPIAHGFLTLSLIPSFLGEIYQVAGLKMGVNYGLDLVRFPDPVPVGARVRATVTLKSTEFGPSGLKAGLRVLIEREGGTKPVCVADFISLMRS